MEKDVFIAAMVLMMVRAVCMYVKFRLINAKFYKLYRRMNDAPLIGYSSLGEKEITPEFETYVKELKARGCTFKEVFCFAPEIKFPYRPFFQEKENLLVSSLHHFFASQFFFWLSITWMLYWEVNGLTILVAFMFGMSTVLSVSD